MADSPHPLLERAREAPTSPGVYRFADARGVVLYVGKARDLKRRVLSYFGRHDLAERTVAMLALARQLDFTVTGSEVEAFILENTLIKREKPRFNVMLKDDKTYPYIKVTTGESWPRVEFTRRVQDDGHTYFGPFLGQSMARQLMELARTRFSVRTCTIEIDGKLERPCLYFHMGACLGPCVEGLTTREDYAESVEELKLFLAGRHKDLLPRLEAGMWVASENEDFERAARLRDLAVVVRRLGEKQDVEIGGGLDADVIAVHSDGAHATVCLLPYREGRLVDKREFHFEGIGDVSRAEVLAAFAAQYYEANPFIPAVVESSVDLTIDESRLIEAYLEHLRGSRVRLTHPRRGQKARRVELADDNAQAAFTLRFRAPRSQAQHLERRLGDLLGHGGPVRTLECFDISHSSGRHTTASCVVWRSGRMERAEYRSFNLKEAGGGDDFAAIGEAVTRRYRRLRDEGREMPDLILIDGGVGQLNAAMAALDGLGLDVPLAALAKREEAVWLPGRDEPLGADDHDPAHLVLRQARNEAHRFALARQRRRRKKKTLASELLNIPGIGPGRARSLLKTFGSVRDVHQATEAALVEHMGPRLGRHVWRHLHAGE